MKLEHIFSLENPQKPSLEDYNIVKAYIALRTNNPIILSKIDQKIKVLENEERANKNI